MFNQDFFLRNMNEFLKALQDIVFYYKEDDFEQSNRILTSSYSFLGETENFFKEKDNETILAFLLGQKKSIEKVRLLGDLYIAHAKISKDKRSIFLNKALYFLKYYDFHSSVFSFELKDKIIHLEKELLKNQ